MSATEVTDVATQTKEQDQTAVDYLEHAVDDLNQARQEAQDDIRSAIDSAISRTREALDDLRSGAEDRAEKLRDRAEERRHEWQHTLEDATEDVRRELGVRAVRAQRTDEALEAMQDEIENRKEDVS
jgi:vacuolar-type H+-ATPase subunit H